MATSNNSNALKTTNSITDLHFASFDEAKAQLKTFSDRNSDDFGINKVKVDGGLFGLGDHKVTGTELNRVTTQVQDYFIKINGFSKDVVKEIGHVYVALESLDKEYIPAILTAVKGAEEASDQAKAAQDDIKETIQKQKRIIGVLEQHKSKLDKLIHLENIDDMWKQSQDLKKEMDSFQADFSEARDQLSQFEKSIKSLQSFANDILDYDHLEEIDDMWERLELAEGNIDSSLSGISELSSKIEAIMQISHINDLECMWNDIGESKKAIADLNTTARNHDNQISSAQKDIIVLLDKKKELDELEHLPDLDKCWADVEVAKENLSIAEKDIRSAEKIIDTLTNDVASLGEFKNDLLDIKHIFDIDKMSEDLAEANNELIRLSTENVRQDEVIQQLRNDLEEKEHILKNRINMGYIFVGGTALITILHFILSVSGVL